MRTKQNLPTQYYCEIDVSNSIAPHIYVQVFSLIQIYSTFSPYTGLNMNLEGYLDEQEI